MPASSWPETSLPKLVETLLRTYEDGRGVNQVEGHDLPNAAVCYRALDRLFTVLFPGFFDEGRPVTRGNLPYYIGDQVNQAYMELLAEAERAFRYDCKVNRCVECDERAKAREAVEHLIEALPGIRETLKADVQAAYDGDPAAQSFDAIILNYPAVDAIATYRLAHELYEKKVPLIPRMWTERAHSRTGIDINPGATIGPEFFIDHGTGVVIGETCVIGRHVALYQGVTLGALAPAKGQELRGVRRHPTIEDDVIIYAGATILGGETVIGKGAVIGGNVWLTRSVEPGTKVLIAKNEPVFLQPGRKRKTSDPAPSAKYECPARPLCEADGTLATLQTREEDRQAKRK